MTHSEENGIRTCVFSYHAEDTKFSGMAKFISFLDLPNSLSILALMIENQFSVGAIG